MLAAGGCSIYEHRPRTCRDYDCRIFAATGVPVDPRTQTAIAQRVGEWEFGYRQEEGRTQHRTLHLAADFLRKNRDLFPPGTLPAQPAQLALLAIRVYRLFASADEIAFVPDSSLVHAILMLLQDSGAPHTEKASDT
jgi:hypothetical protein